MVVLNKIKGATLIETLFATVYIVIVFMISSLVLNNLFYNSIKQNTSAIKNRLYELEYLYLNDKITLPYNDNFESWEVLTEKTDGSMVVFKAINKETKKVIFSTINEE